MKKSIKILWLVVAFGIGAFVLTILLANFGVFGKMPSIEAIQNPSASLASQVYAEDGTLLGKYYLEDRVSVEYKDISKNVIDALISTEDERFFNHSGIDGRSLGRAFFGLGSKGGASTLTMQTAKNLFTENWNTRNILVRMMQKVKESIIAIKLERNFTKNEIITLYLNTVAFSDNVYGIRNASRTFFQKEPDRLNIDEAAVLVGMVNGPGIYNPRTKPKQALDRRNLVINQMVRNDKIDAGLAAELKAKPIELNYKKLDETAGLAPYFRMVLGEELKKWCKNNINSQGDNYDLYRDGLKIYTTINPRMQMYAEEAMSKHLSYLQTILNSQANIKKGTVWNGFENVLQAAMKNSDRWKNLKKDGFSDEEIKKSFHEKTPMKVFAWNDKKELDTVMTPYDSIKYHRQMLQGGFMAMDPMTGEVKAWVGGIDFKTFKYDHVNKNTKRQVGSTIKPLLYSLAIEEGGFTPNTPVEDVQQNFGQYGLVPATASTCTGRTMTMASALAWSRNCATAYIMKQLGPDGNEGAKRFVDFLKSCNLTTPVDPYPSIALGSAEISLFEMMQAYSMYPGRGFNVKPMYITRIEDRNGNVLQSYMPERKQVLNDVTAYELVSMMQGVIRSGTGRRMWGYGVQGEVAGKTGTTNDNSDAWFMGFTPQLLAGVWTGCDDRFIRFRSDVGQGSSAALPVWAYFYAKAAADKNTGLDTKTTFVKPENINLEPMFDYVPQSETEMIEESGQPGDYEYDYVPATSDYNTTEANNIKPAKGSSDNKGGKPKTDSGQKPKAILPAKKADVKVPEF